MALYKCIIIIIVIIIINKMWMLNLISQAYCTQYDQLLAWSWHGLYLSVCPFVCDAVHCG